MKKFMQFFSFAAMTQVILLLNQVALLPMQLRLWGTAPTAAWYAAIALATVTTMADFGLRTAGHVELLRLMQTNDPAAKAEFEQVWAWIRLLVLMVTTIMVIGSGAYAWLYGMNTWAISRTLLTAAYALETLLAIRIVYLDSLGAYSRAEASYFAFAASRLSLAIPALLIFKLHEVGLSVLFLVTSVLGLVVQGWLCDIPGQLFLFRQFPGRFSFRVCLLARYTMAEPFANWVRISLPVLVLTGVAPAAAVTTYVALRAIYGAARTTIQQAARVVSVEVLRVRAARQLKKAESLLAISMLFAGLVGTGVASVVVLDNLRILNLWLKHFDRSLFQMIDLTFALGAPFYCYQLIVALSFRTGALASMARRQYAYVLYSATFACAALMTGSLTVYLALLVAAEIALSASFMVRPNVESTVGYEPKNDWRGFAASGAGSIVVLALWMVVRHTSTDLFRAISVANAIQAGCVLMAVVGLLLIAGLKANTGAVRRLRNTLPLAVVLVKA